MQGNPFSDLRPSPAEHFRLYFYGAVLNLIGNLTRSLGSFDEVFKRFPFLALYSDEIAARGVAGQSVESAGDWWDDAIGSWEQTATAHLPLKALREGANLDRREIGLLICAGLAEEDARFGDIFESLQAPRGCRRPTYGLMQSWQETRSGQVENHSDLRQLIASGFLQVLNREAPRGEWTLQVPALLWDALRGDGRTLQTSWLRFIPPDELRDLKEFVCPEALRKQLEQIPPALASSEARGVIIRGPQRNGRRTAVRGIARALTLGILEVSGLNNSDDERWKILGPLAAVLNAMPVVVLDLGAGETVELPSLSAYDGPLALVLGRHGGVSGTWAERSVAVSIDVPDPGERLAHWTAGDSAHRIEEPGIAAERYRMTSGNIRRAAFVAASYASVKQHACVEPSDIRQAIRSLNHEILDSFAERVETNGDWGNLAVPPHTLEELRNLEARCRHRERLRSSVPPVPGMQLNAGVRALLTGPSGTGKSLAARLLAASLGMDLYRINLGTVVNKYIGETEKNLNTILSRAEELPVMLLLDEGDALLTQRTHVQTSNDRYANLETNFLLQRLESFEGIIVVTTNGGDRIDSAFSRRMDVVIDFRAPDSAERWAIWNMYLPGNHRVDEETISEIALRCSMTGAQIRNAVLQASLVALGNGGTVTSEYLEAAVRREYRKLDAACPLRRAAGN